MGGVCQIYVKDVQIHSNLLPFTEGFYSRTPNFHPENMEVVMPQHVMSSTGLPHVSTRHLQSFQS